MSILQNFKSRVGLSQQGALVDEFVLKQERINSELLEDVDLTGITFSEVIIDNCAFINNDFSGDQFYSSEFSNSTFNHCNFTNCDLHDAVFKNTTFVDCVFVKCEFYDSTFEACTLSHANMDWSYHSLSKFDKGRILNSSFRNATISTCIFHDVQSENNSVNATIIDSKVYDGAELTSESSKVGFFIAGNK